MTRHVSVLKAVRWCGFSEAQVFDTGDQHWHAKAMASCYRCGKVLTGLELRQRRQVYTGESYWVLHARRRQSSHRTHYGMRIVCRACAVKLDWGRGVYQSPAKRAKWFLIVLVLVAAFIGVVVLIANRFIH